MIRTKSDLTRMANTTKKPWPVWIRIVGVISFVWFAFLVKPYVWQLYLSSGMYDSVNKGDITEVQKLLQKGADPNRIGAGGLVGGTPLIWAAEKGDLKMLKVLLQGGADVNNRANSGITALMASPSPKVAQFLLDRGANPRVRNDDGLTAWQCMKYADKPQIAEVIMRAEVKMRSAQQSS